MLRLLLLVSIMVPAALAGAQAMPMPQGKPLPQGKPMHQGMSMPMGGPADTITGNVLRHSGSGTSLEPGAATPSMLMRMTSNGWMLMLHGVGFAVEQQQTGPRGDDKLFAVNWLMPMAMRNLRSWQLTLRT